MIERELQSWLSRVSHYPQVIHVQGLRQSGKTTLLGAFRKQFPHAMHYPLFDVVTLRQYDTHPEHWALEIEEALKSMEGGRVLHVFVDEIQKIPLFFQAIQGLYDQNKGKVKFWIWGSSARALKREKAETLAGRILTKILWPLTQGEILGSESRIPNLFSPELLRKYMQTQSPRAYINNFSDFFLKSMLPEPALLDDMTHIQEILKSYQATYMENEIRRENLVADIGVFERFLALAASEDTGIVNFSSKAKVLGTSPNTIIAYYNILEDTFICNKILAYSKSLRVQLSKSPKIYFTDTGFARFISGERGLPTEDSQTFGRLMEGFVINEISKQVEYRGLPWELSYLRTQKGEMEVDLIITQGAKSVACEIKASAKLERSDYQPLIRLMEMDPSIQHGIVFSRQSAPFELEKNIYNFPIWNL